jgi:predicted nucleic acid-binding protein
MEAVLVDTGAVVALLNADDLFHRQARLILKEMRKKGSTPLLTNFIVAEIFSALLAAVGPDAGRTWLRHNIWPVERVTHADEERAREIILESDGHITYIDGTSVAVMERLGIEGIFTFDPFFAGLGFRLLAVTGGGE